MVGDAPTIYEVANHQPPKKVNLPDVTAAMEGHLWDNLMDPHAPDAAKDVRVWVVEGCPPVLIMNGKELEVIEQVGVNPKFSKWKFRTADAATKFAEMMQPYCTIIGLV